MNRRDFLAVAAVGAAAGSAVPSLAFALAKGSAPELRGPETRTAAPAECSLDDLR